MRRCSSLVDHARRSRFFEQHDDAEHHGGGADDRGADEHRLGGGFEGVARAVALFELVLGVLEVGVEAEVGLDLLLHVLDALDLAQFIDGLGVVGDRAVAVHGDGHRPHAEEAEGHQAEREDRRGEGEVAPASVPSTAGFLEKCNRTTNISSMITSPIQKADILPATKPDRMFSEAPPCFEQFVTSLTCRELVLTNILVNSGISAPATVPQLMMTESTHHRAGCGPAVASLKSPSSS